MSTLATRSVPFLALGGRFEQDDVDAAAKVMSAAAASGGNFFPLPEEGQFQQAFAAHEGARHAVAVNSCGTALDVCMMALNVGPGDEVITTPLTFVCTATCAVARGAKVVFADVDPATLCLDPVKVRRKITPRTKAIIPVHFAGLSAELDAFDAITKETGVPVIYDAAHAVGTRYKGRPIGAAGVASCYSFQSNKNITTLGEGGAITTDNAEFAENVRQKKTFGYVYGAKLRVASIGFNYRMTKPQLAVGLTQIAKAQSVIALKLAAMARMQTLLAGTEGIILPAGIEPGHGAHLYIIRVTVTDRDTFAKHLKDRYQVGTAHHYPVVWSWEAMADVPQDRSDCAIADQASRQVVSLPVFAQSSEDDLQYVAWAVKQSAKELAK
jgi:dTDP-4-amino-4,6-dideoxygalactose transaminase